MQQVPVPNPPNLNLLNPGAWEWESGRFEHEGEEGRKALHAAVTLPWIEHTR